MKIIFFNIIFWSMAPASAESAEELINILGRMSHGSSSLEERTELRMEIERLSVDSADKLKTILMNELLSERRADVAILKGNVINMLSQFPEKYDEITPFLTAYTENIWSNITAQEDFGVPSLLYYFEKADREQAVALALRCLSSNDMGLRAYGSKTMERISASHSEFKDKVQEKLAASAGILLSRPPFPVWKKTIQSPWLWGGLAIVGMVAVMLRRRIKRVWKVILEHLLSTEKF